MNTSPEGYQISEKLGRLPRQNGATDEWTIEDSQHLYGINAWGAGYFGINAKGNVCVTPEGAAGPSVDLTELINDLTERGIRLPILLRFPDIVKARVQLIKGCFDKAIKDYDYKGSYQGVYPIKVNQQRHLVEDIMTFGRDAKLGLECGSKPELLVVLALMKNPEAVIIANGFKDAEYIETALLAQKLGRKTIVVVDRYHELSMILTAAKKLNLVPKIGFRAKLDSKGSGKWIDSSGARSKFGLTPEEIVRGVKLLKENNLLNSLELVHFHIGSQINSIQAVKTSLKEGARIFTELYRMGAPLKYIDVGGGLGVDYDGSGTSEASTNYTEQEYANDVVSIIQSQCDEKSVPHPNIITEAGRALVAHHSVLVFNVLGVNRVTEYRQAYEVTKEDHKIVRDMYETLQTLKLDNINEAYNDAVNLKNDSLQLFSYGYLSLEQRAKAETIFWAIFTKMASILREFDDDHELLPILEQELSDSLYCNFSVFQSVPDAWAVKQIFPVMPIQRLKEEPTRRAVLVDLTCDSDGKLEKFAETGEVKSDLAVHSVDENTQSYHLGVFLLGAYQEVLGDLHNLFGDTDAVIIGVGPSGYTVEHVEQGDSVTEVLAYMEYSRHELINFIRQTTETGIREGRISPQEARLLLKHYEDGLSGYTYLEE